MYAQLGSIQFTAVKGFTGLSATRETNLAEHALIEKKPKLQRVGTNLTTVDVTMFFDISFCNPQTEIDRLNSSRESAEIVPLIMGSGRFVGNFVIKSVSETTTNSAGDGTLLQAEVDVSLLECVNNDEQAWFQSSAIASAFANVNNSPATFIPALKAITPASQATDGLVGANAAINTSAKTLSTLGTFVDLYRPKAEAVVRNMLTSGDKLNDVLEIINANSASELYQRTRELALKISETLIVVADVSVEAEALITDIDEGNTASIPGRVTSLIARSTELSTKSFQLSQKAAELISFVVVQ